PQARALAALLSEVKDVRGTVYRSQAGATLDAVELYEIKRLCAAFQELSRRGQEPGWPAPAEWVPEYPAALARELDPSARGDSAFYIDDGFSPALRRIRGLKHRCEQELAAERQRLEAAAVSSLGLASGWPGELAVARSEARLEELMASELLQLTRELRSHVFFQVRASLRQQELEENLSRLKAREFRAEEAVRRRLSRQVAKSAQLLLENLEKLAKLDLLLAKARLGGRLQATEPRLLEETGLQLTGGRHPGVEESLRR
ncbi:MAG TPA: hypothetical protein DCM14_00480, partial [Clostridiales bacterium UBA8153]|nr:hypothetical protein [Clostridiales bacterium UBA8153]